MSILPINFYRRSKRQFFRKLNNWLINHKAVITSILYAFCTYCVITDVSQVQFLIYQRIFCTRNSGLNEKFFKNNC